VAAPDGVVHRFDPRSPCHLLRLAHLGGELQRGAAQPVLGVAVHRGQLRRQQLNGETGAGGAGGQFGGESQCGLRGRHSIHTGLAALLDGLQLVPAQFLRRCVRDGLGVGEHVRVPVHQLGHQRLCHGVDVETGSVTVLGNTGVEQYLQQDVTELLHDVLAGAGVQCVEQLVALLHQVTAQRVMGLLGVPWTAAGAAQPVHHGDRLEQLFPAHRHGRALNTIALGGAEAATT